MPQPPASEPLPRVGFVLLAAVTLGWGINWPIMKVAIAEFDPLVFRAVTTPLAGLMLLAIARLTGHSLVIPRAVWGPFALSTLVNITAWYVLSAYGVALLSAGRAVLIAYTMPLWASLLGVLWLRERMTVRRALGLASGLAAMAVLMGGDAAALAHSPLGAATMLGAAVSWAIGIVILKRTRWGMPTVSLTAWQLLLGSLPIVAAAALWSPGTILAPSAAALAGMAYNVLVSISLGTLAWYYIVSLFPVSVSSIGTLLLPVVGVVSGSLMLGEPLGWREGAAMALVCGALALVLFEPARRRQPAR